MAQVKRAAGACGTLAPVEAMGAGLRADRAVAAIVYAAALAGTGAAVLYLLRI